jgi:hypothetical protein
MRLERFRSKNVPFPFPVHFQRLARYSCLFWLAATLAATGSGQSLSPANQAARQIVQTVIHNEIDADNNDHTKWMYRDAYQSPAKSVVTLKIETADGTLAKRILIDGHPLNAQEQQQDDTEMQKVIRDPGVRAQQRKNSEHDSQQALALMKMLPDGFLWTQTGEADGKIQLSFQPNPAFNPPSYAARVFAAMAGTMTVDKQQMRLEDLSGKLIRPVEFGWGLFGKIQPGGTFHIVRTQVAPGKWEITQTHVHIEGHILFFKSISQQEDEITSGYVRTPHGLTLQQAYQMLQSGKVAQMIDAAEKK